MPPQAAWHHSGARNGFEVLFATREANGHRLTGQTTAVEDAVGWTVGYVVSTDGFWRTTEVRGSGRTSNGDSHVHMRRNSSNQWWVDGYRRPDLDGCVDIDFESSAVTNTLPIHRLDFAIGDTANVPAAFVRAQNLSVERLEQAYTRLDDTGRFGYMSSTFDFACELTYDRSGLIVDYPSIASRAF